MATGTIKFFDPAKGYGFITTPEGDDLFVHVSKLEPGVRDLDQGQTVEYETAPGRKGPEAVNVRRT